MEKRNQDLIITGLEFIGIRELAAGQHSPTILGWLRQMQGGEAIVADETNWCSAFVSAVARLAGYEHTRSLAARAWLSVGEEVEEPQMGDVVIFWRVSPSSWEGHVGFVVRESANKQVLFVLGGNQGNQVSIAPYSKARVLGFRRLRKI